MEDLEDRLKRAERALEEGKYDEVINVLEGLKLLEGYLLRSQALLMKGFSRGSLGGTGEGPE
jgi:hypothetical protein